jgi:hypothetical protein
MLSASHCRLLGCFLIVLAMVYLSGCDKPINLVPGQNHKIALYPSPGQHLVWLNGVQVRFLGVSPCTEPTGKWLTECHVQSNPKPGNEMKFYYICKDYACNDPEVDVGSGNGPLDYRKSKSSKLMDTVGVSCNAGAVTLDPPDLPDADQDAPLKPGVVVNWVSVGEIKNWSVAFDSAGVCEEDSIHSGGDNTKCTIKQGLTPNTKYTYKATSTDCATQATGSLTTPAP